MSQRKKVRIGDLLVETGVISAEQLQTALVEQKKLGLKLGKALIELGFLTEEKLLEVLSKQLQIPFVDLKHYKFDPDTIRKIPEIQARRFRVLALDASGSDILVGMADQTDIFAYDELTRILNASIRVAVVRESEVIRTIDTVYRKTEEISSFAGELESELAEGDVAAQLLSEGEDIADAPVVRMLQSLFEDAVQMNASDIHIEPNEHALLIRQRIDGILHEQVIDEKRIAQALVLRLKIMAGLDISEKRLPQDGRFSMRVKEHNIDVRLSTMPVAYGESVVMRLLDQSAALMSLDDLGMPADIRERFEHLIESPHGMILVTGPTGSGKTTTLYSAINLLNRPETKIITVEDPVEYRLPRVNQVQVNTDIDLTFSRVLRSALRQDPDVVLVGEMRDEETAEIGLRAAMTGHLVLSTLHTNDAISSVHRLTDMGARGYLLASALTAVVAQRLVKRICESCITDDEPDGATRAWLRSMAGSALDNIQFRRGNGCPHCNNTGYRGRIGVYELLQIDGAMADALGSGDTARFSRLARQAIGKKSLSHVALLDAIDGITSLAEVQRISADIDMVIEEPEAGDAAAATTASASP